MILALTFELNSLLILKLRSLERRSSHKVLGIDPGKKNIGFAICDENKKVATPLKVLQKSKFEVLIKQINQIIKENNIKGIIIGNPINMDGTSSKSSQSASDFAKNLSKNITIPITCLLYTSPSPRDLSTSRMPSSA